MSTNYAAPTWVKAEPVAFSDTVDNIGGTYGPKAIALHNRSAAAMLAHVVLADDKTRVFKISIGDILLGGIHWKRVKATGTTGGGTSGVVYETILTTGNGLAFTNQPANDGVEIVSSNAADTTQSATVYGTTQGTDTVVAETVALNGTTAVATVKVDWGVILGVELSASCAGTVTFREASGNATITTITTGNLSKGVETVPTAVQAASNVTPMVAASDTTTKQVGLAGTNAAGTVIYDSQALTNTTPLAVNSAFYTVTKVFTGDIEANRTVTVSNSSDLLALY